ncbi:MAG: acyl-CoA thioesterase [Verrucomicrobia bacterium]|nr:acyl-CoA thioesterase [Verrucomicrobiota bacterium]
MAGEIIPLPAPARHEKTLLIRHEFLNHYGTVFGGYMMQWADDMAYNAASLAFPGARFVTRCFGQFDFTSPVQLGDIIKIFSGVESVGETSCKIQVWAVNARTGAEVFRTFAVMVNVQEGKKAPLKS